MADPPEQDIGATVYTWCEIIRRARMNQGTKLVALLLASYANPDGTKIFPGAARLAADSGLDVRTVKRAMGALRSSGLIETAHRGNRRRGQSDVYRLILAEDLLDRLDLRDPDEYAEDIETHRALRRMESRQYWGRRRKRELGDAIASPNDAANPTHQGTAVSPDGVIRGQPTPGLGDTRVTPPDHKHQAIDQDQSIDSDRWRDRDLNSQSGRATHVAAMDGTNDLDLAQTNGNQGTDRRKWAEIQDRYDNGEIDDEFICDVIGLEVGWELDTVEQRTVEGMLANGSHVKAIANKIAADRSVP